jgi:hypothetical protein
MGTFFINFASKSDIFNQIIESAASLLGDRAGLPVDLNALQGLDPSALVSTLGGIDPKQLAGILSGFGINL